MKSYNRENIKVEPWSAEDLEEELAAVEETLTHLKRGKESAHVQGKPFLFRSLSSSHRLTIHGHHDRVIRWLEELEDAIREELDSR